MANSSFVIVEGMLEAEKGGILRGPLDEEAGGDDDCAWANRPVSDGALKPLPHRIETSSSTVDSSV